MKFQFLLVFMFLLIGCKRYEDPSPFTDPRIVNKYCNIPSAINYNWDFPGVPNDSVCIFPAQIYQGSYFYHDSVFNNAGLLLSEDSFQLIFTQLDSTRMTIEGFCPGNVIHATATRFFKFTIDSLVGNGQLLCNTADTIMGRGSKFDIYDTTTIKLTYDVGTDSNVIYHSGTAIKQ